MPTDPHITTRTRQIAAELRRMRRELGMSCADVAGRLGVSVSKISRLETGHVRPRIEDVADLLRLYNVPGNEREEVLGMIRRSNEKHWWDRRSGLPKRWRMIFGLQAEATRIRELGLLTLPALLQTAEYAHTLLDATSMFYSDTTVEDLVDLRMASQDVLTEPNGPAYEVVVREQVLDTTMGGDGVMRGQLRHLLTVLDRRNVRLRMLPLRAGAHAGMDGAFTLLEFDDGSTLLHQDHAIGPLYFELETDIERYDRKWRLIGERCLSEAETVEYIRRQVDRPSSPESSA